MSGAQEAYFVPRSEILAWINSTLCLRLTKVEETANGAVACQLLDALYPNTVPMKKVDFNAKNDYDMINNYKVMQDVFNKLGVEKHVDVSKLIKARPLDNTEFMQWFKAYWDKTTGGQTITDYDPVARRQQCKTGGIKGSDAAAPAAKSAGALTGSLPQRRVPATYAGKATTPPPAPAVSRSKRSLIASSMQPSDAETIEQLQEEVATWRCAAETCTKEKDFYYSKLRAVELLCNAAGVRGHPIAKAVEEILYAATQEEGEAHLTTAMAQFNLHEDELLEGEEQHADSAHLAPEGSAGVHEEAEEQQHLQQQHYLEEAAAAAY